MSSWRRALLSLLPGIVASTGHAQTASPRDLSIRDAFLVAPWAALPPFSPTHGDRQLLVRVGGWQYYVTEPVHANAGITLVRPNGKESWIAATLVYNSPPCRGCSHWVLGGLDYQRRLRGPAGLRGSVGFGHPLEFNLSSSTAVSLALPLEVRTSDVFAGITPGISLAGIQTSRLTARGVRPTLAMLVGIRGEKWDLAFGGQGVVLRSSAPVVGITLSRRSSRSLRE